MKRLLILLSLMAGAAHAEPGFVNLNGVAGSGVAGRITLTEINCPSNCEVIVEGVAYGLDKRPRRTPYISLFYAPDDDLDCVGPLFVIGEWTFDNKGRGRLRARVPGNVTDFTTLSIRTHPELELVSCGVVETYGPSS
jgi:hypothetical protein